MPPILQTVLAVLGGIGGLLALAGVIYTARSSRRATTEVRDAGWNAGYRAAAERHIRWDAVIVNLLGDAFREINTLREAQDLPAKPMPDIPEPPALFPDFNDKK